MPERVMRAESAADIRQGLAPVPPDSDVLRQIAGAVSALAGRVERLEEQVCAGQQPKVSPADRGKSLEQAREFVADLRTKPASEAERVANELAVARYLTGE